MEIPGGPDPLLGTFSHTSTVCPARLFTLSNPTCVMGPPAMGPHRMMVDWGHGINVLSMVPDPAVGAQHMLALIVFLLF